MSARPQTPEEFWENVRAHPERTQQEFWEGLYAAHPPRGERASETDFVLTEMEGVAPGSALELGCGEGGDAVALARRG